MGGQPPPPIYKVMFKRLTDEQVRKRILRAIKKGNNEPKYIIEACKLELDYFQYCKVIADLLSDGLIICKKDLGYYLA